MIPSKPQAFCASSVDVARWAFVFLATQIYTYKYHPPNPPTRYTADLSVSEPLNKRRNLTRRRCVFLGVNVKKKKKKNLYLLYICNSVQQQGMNGTDGQYRELSCAPCHITALTFSCPCL